MNKRSFFVLAILLVLIASFFVERKIKRSHAPAINLPGLALKDLNGTPMNLASFSGKPLVINFWGTWCGPCRQELPGFEKAWKKYGGKINLLVVSDEQSGKLLTFKAANNYTFFYAQSQTTFHDLGIPSVPFTYFYDAKGKLIRKIKDPLTEDELNGYIEEMIKE